MPRHLDFRDNRYAALRSIFDDFFSFFLCVITSIRNAVKAYVSVERSYQGLFTHRPCLSKVRILLYLQSPALIVRQMPMECVYFMKGEYVDIVLDFLDIEEMSAHIQVSSTVGECRIVFNVQAFNAGGILRRELKDGHQRVPCTLS